MDIDSVIPSAQNPRRAMTILVLAHVFPRTREDTFGAFLLHLYAALAARGIAINVLAPHAENLREADAFGAVRVRRFHYAPARFERLAYRGTMHELVARGIGNKILFAIFCAAFFFSALRAARATILHAHWWFPDGFIGALVSYLTRAPLVITTHGTDVEILRRHAWAKFLARFAFARARAITCGSNYLRAQLIELQVADAARVRVVPMPVAPAFLNFELPADHARSPRKILTVARLTKQKNIETLLEAMIPLQRILRAELRIIGDGPERAALEKFARARNLTNVEFLGAVPQKDLPRYYAECAVFVLPSIREGMGLVLAEALLCGAPVIAMNSGGVTDIAQENETGLLVPERDVRALVDAICRIFADPALAARLAHNGAARVRERFSSARVAEIFHEIFSSVHRSSSTV